MAASATTANFLCSLRGGTAGDRDIVVQWSLGSPIENEQIVTLTQNTTTNITIPDSTTLIVVIPPTDNTQQIRVDDASGKKCGLITPFILLADGDTTLTLHLASGDDQAVRVICL
jgi:hypothetical protein